MPFIINGKVFITSFPHKMSSLVPLSELGFEFFNVPVCILYSTVGLYSVINTNKLGLLLDIARQTKSLEDRRPLEPKAGRAKGSRERRPARLKVHENYFTRIVCSCWLNVGLCSEVVEN